jgi:hypothetical protein
MEPVPLHRRQKPKNPTSQRPLRPLFTVNIHPKLRYPIVWTVAAVFLTGCAPSALQMADSEADAARKAIPQAVQIDVPFDAAKAKADLAKGNRSISGVLYHRLDVTGRDKTGWPASPLIKNQPFGNIGIFLYPASPPMAAFGKLRQEQQSTMKKWYTHEPSMLNRQPQTKKFVLPAGTTDYAIESKTDKFGRYSFNNLKPGRYYLYAEGWQAGTYNKDVYAGSSDYSDGTGLYGVRGTVNHSRAVPVKFKTYLIYAEFVDVSSDSATQDSRMQVDYNRMSIEYDK